MSSSVMTDLGIVYPFLPKYPALRTFSLYSGFKIKESFKVDCFKFFFLFMIHCYTMDTQYYLYLG